jgi:hypothetical protein
MIAWLVSTQTSWKGPSLGAGRESYLTFNLHRLLIFLGTSTLECGTCTSCGLHCNPIFVKQ